MKRNLKKLLLIPTASVLTLSLALEAVAELPPVETKVSISEQNGSSSASASSSEEVVVQDGSGFWMDPSGVTVEVNSNADAAATSQGQGDASATASTSTTVTVTTGDGFGPYWPLPPYIPPRRHSSGSTTVKTVETIVKTTPVTGTGYTLKSKVNVRALASINSNRAALIRNSGTVVEVTQEVLNSAGEIWYAVKMYNGTMGYILGSLLHVEITPLLPEATEEPEKIVYVYVTPVPAAGVTPEVIYVPVAQEAPPTPTPNIVYVPQPASPQVTPTPNIVYVPQATAAPAANQEPRVIYLTPDPAQTDASEDGEPVNG